MARTTAKGLNLLYAQEVIGFGNGSTTSFALSNVPYSQNAVMVFLDSVPQVAGTDWTLSSQNVAFTTAPAVGQQVFAWYLRKS